MGRWDAGKNKKPTGKNQKQVRQVAGVMSQFTDASDVFQSVDGAVAIQRKAHKVRG